MTKYRKQRQDRLVRASLNGNPVLDGWRNFRKHPASMAALLVLIALVATAIVSGFVFDYKEIVAINPTERMQAPNANHWFGTDDFGPVCQNPLWFPLQPVHWYHRILFQHGAGHSGGCQLRLFWGCV